MDNEMPKLSLTSLVGFLKFNYSLLFSYLTKITLFGCLIIAYSCGIESSQQITKNQSTYNSDLSAVHDDKLLFRLMPINGSHTRFIFEVCDVDFLASYNDKSCFPTYINRNGDPVVFRFSSDDDLINMLTHGLSDRLLELQEKYSTYHDLFQSYSLKHTVFARIKDLLMLISLGLLSTRGIDAVYNFNPMLISAHPNILNAVTHISNFITKHNLRSNILIGSGIAAGLAVILQLLQNRSYQIAQEARKNAIQARISYGKDMTQDFLDQYRDLSQLLNNWGFVTSSDPNTIEAVSSTKDLIADLGAFMRNMLLFEKSSTIDRYCIPNPNALKIIRDKFCYEVTKIKLRDIVEKKPPADNQTSPSSSSKNNPSNLNKNNEDQKLHNEYDIIDAVHF